MKVYILQHFEDVEGVFSSKEKALSYMKTMIPDREVKFNSDTNNYFIEMGNTKLYCFTLCQMEVQ